MITLIPDAARLLADAPWYQDTPSTLNLPRRCRVTRNHISPGGPRGLTFWEYCPEHGWQPENHA